MTPKPVLVELDYADGEGHFSEVVAATEAQAATLREILTRAEAVEAIRSGWYAGDPQLEPTPFEEFLERLWSAVGAGVVDPAADREADPAATEETP